MKLILVALVLTVKSAGFAAAADVYKCVSKDKAIIYSDTPCPGTKPITPRVYQIPNTKNFTNYQVNTAFDCIEALDSVAYRDANPSVNIPAYETANMRNQFNTLCGAIGFKTPHGISTQAFNKEYAKGLKADLDNNNHTGPTFTRSYEGGRRTPPVFSGY